MKTKKHINIPIFIPELACPNRCKFCNQQSISGQINIPDEKSIRSIIKNYLSTVSEETDVEIAFFGGNFTGIPISDQIKYLSLANEYLGDRVKKIRISTRPDYINKQILENLKLFNVKTIELGTQSMFNDVLTASGRGHTVEDSVNAAGLIKDYGFDLGLQMMIGLPSDSREKSVETAKQIVSLGAVSTRIYPLLVIKNTEIEKLYYQHEYTPLSVDDAVRITAELVRIFENNNVKILKVGLHPSEAFTKGGELIAGPFHSSFRELVYTYIWGEIFNSYKFIKSKEIIIYVAPSEINFAAGYQAVNKNYIQQQFGKVKFGTDVNLTGRNFYVLYR